MHAIILSVGDELVLGQTLDTNSQWLSQQLAGNGCDPIAHMTVSDSQSAIEDAVRACAPRCDVLLISGGIGPTADDLTRQALAAVMGVPLVLNDAWVTEMERFFKLRGRPMPEQNKIQAMIPQGATMIWNHAGTAAGIRATIEGSGFGVQGSTAQSLNPEPRTLNPHKCETFVMPGVPKEMKIMFARDVLPFIQHHAAGSCILSRTLHTFGLGESAVAQLLGDLMRRDGNPSVGTTVSQGQVSLRVNARFCDRQQAEEELTRTVGECRRVLGDLIFAEDDQTLAHAVADLLKNDPVARKWAPAVATAESCTGGLLAKYLTDIPGSSAYFRQGYITYANEAKTDLLNVPPELIAQHGAVSEPVAAAMARGTQTQSGAVYSLAITGIAGPDGGTPDKPVGTVCIALASNSQLVARTFNFPGDREMIRDRSAKMAMTMLRYHLLDKPMPF